MEEEQLSPDAAWVVALTDEMRIEDAEALARTERLLKAYFALARNGEEVNGEEVNDD